MEPTIKPVLDLTSLVDRISPEKRRIIGILKILSAIQQLQPGIDVILEQAYREYRRDLDVVAEIDRQFDRLADSEAFQEALREAGGTVLLEALQKWAASMNLANWAKRNEKRDAIEPLQDTAITLGYGVLKARYELEKEGLESNFPAAYTVLQRSILLVTPESSLPTLNSDSNRLKLPFFDPTLTTAERFRMECDALIEEHIRNVDAAYSALGYETSHGGTEDRKIQKSRPFHRFDSGKTGSRRMKAEQRRIARAVWDVLTAQSADKAAAKAAEHQYLIDEEAMQSAVKEVVKPLFSASKRARFAFVGSRLINHDGDLQPPIEEDQVT